MDASTLAGRLICASNSTYSIKADGILAEEPKDIYYLGAGFLQPPVTFLGSDERIDGCLVGAIPGGVVVAFRGTLRFDIHRHATLLDWFNEFNAQPIAADDYPGQVHRGFLAALLTLWDRVVVEGKRQRAGPAAEAPLLVPGHSKGIALAALAAWRMQTVLGIPTKVGTLAGAKAGDQSFRDAYNAQVDHTRYEYADDIVPHLPLWQGGFIDVLSSLPVFGSRFAGLERFDYETVGTLCFISWSGQFSGDTPALTVERTLSLVRLIIRLRCLQIGMDHSIDCASGYISAVCPPGVCPQAMP